MKTKLLLFLLITVSASAQDASVSAAGTAINSMQAQVVNAATGIILLSMLWAGVKLGKDLLHRAGWEDEEEIAPMNDGVQPYFSQGVPDMDLEDVEDDYPGGPGQPSEEQSSYVASIIGDTYDIEDDEEERECDPCQDPASWDIIQEMIDSGDYEGARRGCEEHGINASDFNWG